MCDIVPLLFIWWNLIATRVCNIYLFFSYAYVKLTYCQFKVAHHLHASNDNRICQSFIIMIFFFPSFWGFVMYLCLCTDGLASFFFCFKFIIILVPDWLFTEALLGKSVLNHHLRSLIKLKTRPLNRLSFVTQNRHHLALQRVRKVVSHYSY